MNKLFSAIATLFAFSALAFGQYSNAPTTLNGSIGRGDTVLTLTSSTGVTAAGLSPVTGLYMDREYMEVVSNTNASGTGNMWNVRRGVGGIQSAHNSGTVVWVGTPGAFDKGPNDRVGACTYAALPFPIVNIKSGDVQVCAINGQWTQFGVYGESNVGSVIASATTIVVTNPVVHVSGTTAIATITANAITPGQTITLIPDGIFTTTTAGNISLASTAVVGKALIMTWDGTKYNPSY
jgi:hypothetical protein